MSKAKKSAGEKVSKAGTVELEEAELAGVAGGEVYLRLLTSNGPTLNAAADLDYKIDSLTQKVSPPIAKTTPKR
ncbi:hypothetical protein [Parasphingopyxis marina]|uniref:Uncharacterized protein n=1 Tax=Parasphingopyxis marina TaxID=2761622 RepID=A0A842HXL8_9SPHN|nr:hypothetical protein [Parasphingopyxis marina]MBC2777059.1 hypothetical protein [Parasphingopyxis marina]